MISRRIAQGLVLTVALGLIVVLAAGVYRGSTRKEERAQRLSEVRDASEAEMKLTDMEYTEMQQGRRLWSLKASEAKYFQNEQRSLLTSVHFTFYFQNGQEANLNSNRGILYAGSKNIELWDSVKADLPKGYEVTTERIFYEHQRQVIFSETPVQITGPEGQLHGGSWEYNLQEHKASLRGGVEATLSSWPPAMQLTQ
jgi:LPS export ABC transporter protein LptC